MTHLDGLPMSSENVDSNDRLSELRVSTLHNVIVDMFLISESVKRLEDKFEKSFQILRIGRCDKDIGVVMREG